MFADENASHRDANIIIVRMDIITIIDISDDDDDDRLQRYNDDR